MKIPHNDRIIAKRTRWLVAVIALIFLYVFIGTLPTVFDILFHRGDKVEITKALVYRDPKYVLRRGYSKCPRYTFKFDQEYLQQERCYFFFPGYNLPGDIVNIYYYKDKPSDNGVVRLLCYRSLCSLLFALMALAYIFFDSHFDLYSRFKNSKSNKQIMDEQKQDYLSAIERKAKIQRELEGKYDKESGSAYD